VIDVGTPGKLVSSAATTSLTFGEFPPIWVSDIVLANFSGRMDALTDERDVSRRRLSVAEAQKSVWITGVLCETLQVYWLPPEAGEKVSLGVTVLLAFSVFQLVISDSTPENSDVTPLLSESRKKPFISLLFFFSTDNKVLKRGPYFSNFLKKNCPEIFQSSSS